MAAAGIPVVHREDDGDERTNARLAFALLRYTGICRSDVLKLSEGMERESALHFTVTKGALRNVRESGYFLVTPQNTAIGGNGDGNPMLSRAAPRPRHSPSGMWVTTCMA
jgi:hypothetical protein